MDHVPHYPHISPVEVIDLNMNSHSSNEQVRLATLADVRIRLPFQSSRQATQSAVSAWLTSGSNMDVGTDCTFLMAL